MAERRSAASKPAPPTVWTVGHSTHPLDEFLALLASRRIAAIADVRRFPGSRRHPHFAREAMELSLPAAGIAYHWLPELGGRRKPLPDSPNTGWRNLSFRGFADHLASAEFADGLGKLLSIAAQQRCALMCSELLWWRCHRALIADVLTLRGIEVVHVLGSGKDTVHSYSKPARVSGGRLSYPPAADTA